MRRPLTLAMLVGILVACVDPHGATAPRPPDHSCPAGKARCGDFCVDRSADPDHCGDCSIACAGGQSCNNGNCACPDGQIACENACVDPSTSADHCGASGSCRGPEAGLTCEDGFRCSEGRCACDTSGQLTCDGACIDPLASIRHCGASGDCQGAAQGRVCLSGQSCMRGVCTCGAGQVVCAGACVSPEFDPAHCGAAGDCQGDQAGTVCAMDQVCIQGVCTCPSAYVECDGSCIDPRTNVFHCGASASCSGGLLAGMRCDPDEQCLGGHCVVDDTTLAELDTAIGNLAPAFDPSVTEYLYVPDALEVTLVLRARPTSPLAALTLDGMPLGVMEKRQVAIERAGQVLSLVVHSPRGGTRAYHVTLLQPQVLQQPGSSSFGEAVALSGDTLAVGSSGAVSVYTRSGGSWSLLARLLPVPLDSGFGERLRLVGDRLAVGAPGESGAVHVFRRSSAGLWSLEVRLRSAGALAGSKAGFGAGVDISGSRLVVVAPRERVPDGGAKGVLHSYEEGTWSPEVPLDICSTLTCKAGQGVALAGDHLVVGGTDGQDGFLWMFAWSGLGWTATDTIRGPPPSAAGPILATDGATLLSAETGVVHSFSLVGDRWMPEQDVAQPELPPSDVFGAVAISGERFAVGDPAAAGGLAFVCSKVGPRWQKEFLLPSPWAAAAMGSSVALDGHTLAVGAPGAPDGGAVLMYDLP